MPEAEARRAWGTRVGSAAESIGTAQRAVRRRAEHTGMKYWINVLSKDHVTAGIAGGFTQAHGDKADQLQLQAKGDLIFFYSPGTLFRAGQILQAFTAVARVVDDAPYQVKGSGKVQAWRRNVTAVACEEVPAVALIPQLAFITDKANWGASLRRSLFEISEDDACRIAAAMNASIGGA